VAWWDRSGQEMPDHGNGGIQARRYGTSGVPLGGEFQVNTQEDNNQRDPSVAMDPTGNRVVVWTDEDADACGERSCIKGQRYAASGAPAGPEFRVNTVDAGWQYHSVVAMNDAGAFIVVWEDDSGQDGSVGFDGGTGVQGQRYDPNGMPV